MKIISTGGRSLFATLINGCPQIGFVRCLILAKPDITIDAEHAFLCSKMPDTAIFFSVSINYFLNKPTKVGTCCFILRTVRIKPGFIIILFYVFQEFEC